MRPGEPGASPRYGCRDRDLRSALIFLPWLSSSFDNSSLCSGGGDKAVVLWDVASGQVVRKFRGHAGVSTNEKRPH